MSDAPDIHICEVGPRDGPQNPGEGRSAIRRRGHGERAHAIYGAPIPERPTDHLREAEVPKAPWRLA